MATFKGRVTGGGLNLRLSPSTGASSPVQIPNNTELVVSTVLGNQEWFSTTYLTYSGYVMAQFVAITEDGGTCTVTTTSDALNIRKSASTGASVVYTAAKGSTLRLLDYDSFVGWYQVSSASGTGWGSSSYLTITSYPNGGSGGGTGDDSYPISATIDTVKHGVGGTVNLRSAASQSASIVTTIDDRSTIYVQSLAGTWLAARYLNYTGYIMAKFVVGSDEYNTSSGSGNWYSSNKPLPLAEMTVNAQYILNYLRDRGWTKNAVCGMLGNMQVESTINPGIWENGNEGNLNGGFGLVQWTPATKYTKWANSHGYEWGNMDGQLQRIIYEVTATGDEKQWLSTGAYPMSFSQFTASYDTPYKLACAFLRNYERPKNPSSSEAQRGNNATDWYNLLS